MNKAWGWLVENGCWAAAVLGLGVISAPIVIFAVKVWFHTIHLAWISPVP